MGGSTHRTERASALLVVVVVVSVVAAVTAATARAGSGVLARQQAQSVADVAALAGAAQGPAAARLVTERNGARLVAVSRRSDQALELTVRLGAVTASAAAAAP